MLDADVFVWVRGLSDANVLLQVFYPNCEDVSSKRRLGFQLVQSCHALIFIVDCLVTICVIKNTTVADILSTGAV